MGSAKRSSFPLKNAEVAAAMIAVEKSQFIGSTQVHRSHPAEWGWVAVSGNRHKQLALRLWGVHTFIPSSSSSSENSKQIQSLG